MDQNRTAIERAFDIAQSGQFGSVADIKKAVSAEGYSVAQLAGTLLSRQLREIIRTVRVAEGDH